MKHKHRAVFGNPRCSCGERLVRPDRAEPSEPCKEGQHLIQAGSWDGTCVNCGRFVWKLPGDLGAYLHGPDREYERWIDSLEGNWTDAA